MCEVSEAWAALPLETSRQPDLQGFEWMGEVFRRRGEGSSDGSGGAGHDWEEVDKIVLQSEYATAITLDWRVCKKIFTNCEL